MATSTWEMHIVIDHFRRVQETWKRTATCSLQELCAHYSRTIKQTRMRLGAEDAHQTLPAVGVLPRGRESVSYRIRTRGFVVVRGESMDWMVPIDYETPNVYQLQLKDHRIAQLEVVHLGVYFSLKVSALMSTLQRPVLTRACPFALITSDLTCVGVPCQSLA
eukprot:4707138-Amphidinium_carterae.1